MGAIGPVRRISKTRKRQRRSHSRLDNPSLMVCPNCGELKLTHCVCAACGWYDGKQVKEIKAEKEDAEAAASKKKTAKKTAKEAKKEGKKEKAVK